MEASNTSKNLALISGWVQRSPERKAGSNLDVMSLPERLSSLCNMIDKTIISKCLQAALFIRAEHRRFVGNKIFNSLRTSAGTESSHGNDVWDKTTVRQLWKTRYNIKHKNKVHAEVTGATAPCDDSTFMKPIIFSCCCKTCWFIFVWKPSSVLVSNTCVSWRTWI